MRKYLILVTLILATKVGADGLTDGANQVILMDMNSGRVLLEKNGYEKMHPSSMTKVPALFPLFERLKQGRLTVEDKLPVSVRAWKQEGSRMFLEPNTSVSIGDLLRGIIVQSGNDATTVVAEGLSGTEEQYAHEMNQYLAKVGIKNSHFINASGLPDDNHFTTAYDMARMAVELIGRYPEYYPIFSEKNFTYNNIRQGNRNPLLYKRGLPVDGIKTGQSSLGGYGIVASAKQNDLRLIVVVNGTQSVNDRSRISENILRWGFREFKEYKLFDAGEVLDYVNVWLGNEAKVPLLVPENISLTLSYREYSKLKMRIKYKSPVAAPIMTGQEIGKLIIEVPGITPLEYPLVAGSSVEEVGMFGRALSTIYYTIWGVGK